MSFIVGRRVHKVAISDYQLCLARVQQLGPHWTGFHEISYFSIIGKSVEKTEVSLKSDKKESVLYMKTDIHFSSHIYSRVLLRMRNVSG